MLIKTNDGRTIEAQYGDKILEIGPKAQEYGPDEARFILSPYFARNWSPNVEAVKPKEKVVAAVSEDTEP